MKLAKFIYKTSDGEKISWGILGDENIELINGTPFGDWEHTGHIIKDYEVRYLTPCEPTKIVCVGLNYKDHAEELNLEIPEEPVIFLKPSTSVLGPGGFIVKPKACNQLDFEAELAVVIKKQAKNISIDDAKKFILGYTCFNDVTARDLQKKDKQWTRAKSFDTFAPVGPIITSNIDPNKLKIELFLNEEVKQTSNTSHMIFRIDEIVSFVSKVMTLNPGDVIATGTPPGVGSMEVGDVVEVVIEGIGSLRNYVSNEE